MPRQPDDETDRYIGTRLKAVRIKRGMSQTNLAGAVGLSFQQLQKYESGKNSISPRYLIQFAEILDTPIAYFFSESAIDHLSDGRNLPRAPSRLDFEILELLGKLDMPTKIAWRELLRAIAERPGRQSPDI